MNDLWKYFPESDTWIQKADFIGTPRKGAASWSNGTKGFVATGEDNQFNYTQDVYEFNPIMNSWIQRADFIGPGRTNAIAFFLDGLAYLGTGYNGELLDDFYGYQGILGIEELNARYHIQVFPNPMVTSVKVTSLFEIKKIEMIDLKGQIVSDKVVLKLQGKSAVIENVGLTSGVYFIQILGDDQDQLFTKRLLVK